MPYQEAQYKLPILLGLQPFKLARPNMIFQDNFALESKKGSSKKSKMVKKIKITKISECPDSHHPIQQKKMINLGLSESQKLRINDLKYTFAYKMVVYP